MSNWYKKADSMYGTHDQFYYDVTFKVWVPQGMGQEIGKKVLAERLKKATGESEVDTPGINANISMREIRQL